VLRAELGTVERAVVFQLLDFCTRQLIRGSFAGPLAFVTKGQGLVTRWLEAVITSAGAGAITEVFPGLPVACRGGCARGLAAYRLAR
jgi:hypothetical protein